MSTGTRAKSVPAGASTEEEGATMELSPFGSAASGGSGGQDVRGCGKRRLQAAYQPRPPGGSPARAPFPGRRRHNPTQIDIAPDTIRQLLQSGAMDTRLRILIAKPGLDGHDRG